MSDDLWFTPRLTIPDPTDKYWIKQGYGGYNRCVLGSPAYSYGSVLSDCTGYAWGRFLELLQATDCNLSTANAGAWYGHTSDGYARSTTTPKLGAVVCWGGSGVQGHVAVIEQIFYNSGGSVDHCVVSQSGWGWTDTFRTRTIQPSNNWWIYNDVGTFQGFIYLPIDYALPCPIKFRKRNKIKVVIR